MISASEKEYEKLDVKKLFEIFSEDKSNIAIRNILIEKNLFIAKILSKKYMNKGVDYEDIYQVASLALIYAVDRYDVSKGFEFSSFATPTIVGEIKKYFRDKVWTLKIPRRIQDLNKKISNAKVFLEQEHKHTPTPHEIAEYLGVTDEEVLEAMEASYGYQPISLDMPSSEDSEDKDVTLGDRIGAEEDNFAQIEHKDFIEKFSKNLNEYEVKILSGRFFSGKTQSAIAEELGISQMTVSRLEKKIIEKLKKEYNKAV